MEKPNDGELAFPVSGESCWDPGMSLRAYLAAKAMQGLVAGITNLEANGIIENRPQDVSELAVLYADTLLAELERGVKAPEEAKPPLPPGLQREPKFKDGDSVRVVAGPRCTFGRVGVVRSSSDDPTHGWRYEVEVGTGYGSSEFVKGIGENYLEAAGEGAKDE